MPNLRFVVQPRSSWPTWSSSFQNRKKRENFHSRPRRTHCQDFLKSVGQMLPRLSRSYMMCGSFSIVLVHEVPL